jgi:hypothetical protein
MSSYHYHRVTVRVPLDEEERFQATMTGVDDDVILAAETAIRRRLDADAAAHPDWTPSCVELDYNGSGTIGD